MKEKRRKHPRLKDYDYSQPGGYFVTFCTKNREMLLGMDTGIADVGPDAPIGPHTGLTTLGMWTRQAIRSAGDTYPHIDIDYVIMPNHVHMVIKIAEQEGTEDIGPMRASGPTVGMVVRGIKTLVTRKAGYPIWQEKFYDHVIRDEEEYRRIVQYMADNPAKWKEDEYYAP